MLSTELLLKRARRAVAENRIGDARTACNDAVGRDPKCAEAFQMLGEMAWNGAAMREAAGYFQQAALADPKSARPRAWLANTLVLMNLAGRARPIAEEAYGLKPRDAPSVDRLAQTFSMLGDYERSRELFKQAVLLAPRKPDYWVNLGYAQQYLGDLAGAANSSKRALAIDADFEAAYFPLVAISKQTAEQNFIGKLETLFAAAGDDVERSLRLGHSLSKSFEDLGQPVETKTCSRRR
jgi:tetratricopeptide (TPR) repeat protein